MRISDWSSDVCSSDLFDSIQLSFYSQLFRFDRDQEREADLLGLGYLNGSSFRPQAASTLWKNVMAEQEASASARGLKKPNFEKVAFFSTHPPDAERANTLAALAAPDGADRDDGADRNPAALASTEARRVGKEGASTCRSRWSPDH